MSVTVLDCVENGTLLIWTKEMKWTDRCSFIYIHHDGMFSILTNIAHTYRYIVRRLVWMDERMNVMRCNWSDGYLTCASVYAMVRLHLIWFVFSFFFFLLRFVSFTHFIISICSWLIFMPVDSFQLEVAVKSGNK